MINDSSPSGDRAAQWGHQKWSLVNARPRAISEARNNHCVSRVRVMGALRDAHVVGLRSVPDRSLPDYFFLAMAISFVGAAAVPVVFRVWGARADTAAQLERRLVLCMLGLLLSGLIWILLVIVSLVVTFFTPRLLP